MPLDPHRPQALRTPAEGAGRYLRVREAAAYAGVSKSLLDKLRCTGDGPAFYKPGSLILYRPVDLDAWIEAHRRQSTTDDPEPLQAAE
jgi:predicted DNA-binding transcriptional regulator AlpA